MLRTEHHGFSVRRGRVLLEQSQDRWRGMWMLPRLAMAPAKRKPLHVAEFPFTNHRITLTVFPQTAARRSGKIHPALVSYRRTSINPVTFAPSPGVGDVDFCEVTKTLRPGDSDLISPNALRTKS